MIKILWVDVKTCDLPKILSEENNLDKVLIITSFQNKDVLLTSQGIDRSFAVLNNGGDHKFYVINPALTQYSLEILV